LTAVALISILIQNKYHKYLFYLFFVRLSLHTDFALRTLIYLAGKPGRASVAQVAEFYRISKDHVAKVVQSLVRLGYVRSVRGIGGGIELLKKPDEIRVGQVIRDFEGHTYLLECVAVENVCTIQTGCRLRGVLAQAEKLQMDYLSTVHLSDVVQPGGQLLEITGGPAELLTTSP
jgi:Rrf2 family nitric oxide-sensitive transcriptional repressor